ncbi:MAG: hypothetical protein JWP13_160 [Candidatus Saccharibacteria bacterium]|nr:hypothetical protein [Candidatus Saccharibacteria bacterium]
MALTTPKRKTSVHRRKAQGEHHRHSKHYLKAYHPYLPLLFLVIVGLAINVIWTARTNVLGSSTSLTSTELLQDTNNERLHNNQDPLKLNAKLSSAAQAKANDMAAKNYWSHTAPSGDKPWKFIQKSGYEYYAAGENLAYGFGDSSATITGWMNSREHRANLLHPDYQEVGFGIMTAKNYQGHGQTTIVVAMYAEPAIPGLSDFSSAATIVQPDVPLRTVSRVQLLTGGTAPWSYSLILLATLIAAAWFIIRHLKFWHRVVVQSEEFIVEHKFLDVLIVAAAVTGFLLTRTAGFLH